MFDARLRTSFDAFTSFASVRTYTDAIVNFIASPTGARVAAWAPHVFLTEGAVLLSSARTAPFVSPIKVTVHEKNAPVAPNAPYAEDMKQLGNAKDTWVWKFTNAKELLAAAEDISNKLGGKVEK